MSGSRCRLINKRTDNRDPGAIIVNKKRHTVV